MPPNYDRRQDLNTATLLASFTDDRRNALILVNCNIKGTSMSRLLVFLRVVQRSIGSWPQCGFLFSDSVLSGFRVSGLL